MGLWDQYLILPTHQFWYFLKLLIFTSLSIYPSRVANTGCIILACTLIKLTITSSFRNGFSWNFRRIHIKLCLKSFVSKVFSWFILTSINVIFIEHSNLFRAEIKKTPQEIFQFPMGVKIEKKLFKNDKKEKKLLFLFQF